MKKQLEVKNFDLVKLKVNSKGGLNVSFYEKGNNNELFLVESDNQPHPDFTEKLAQLKEVFALSLGILDGWSFARENNRKNDEVLRDAMRLYKEEIERCNVTGLVLVGKDQYLGLKLTGSLKCIVGSVGLASPNIRFDGEELGVEAQSKILFEDIQKEVWLYLFKNKKAQLDLIDLIDVVGEEEVNGLNNMKIAK